MKRMKKLVSIMLCILIVITIFASCKKDNAGEDTYAPIATEEPVAVEEPVATEALIVDVEPTNVPSAEPLEIALGIWPTDTHAGEIALHEGYVAEFATTHPDITVVPANYSYAEDTFKPLAEAGGLPVIFQMYYTDAQKIIEDGYAADITDILEARGWLDAVNPSIKELISKDGRLYGIPCDGYALGLMVNVALFKEAGIVNADGLPIYPKTWTELAEIGKKIKDATGVAGLCLLASDVAAGWHFTNIAWAFGATFTTENTDGTLTYNLDSPEAIAAMEFVKSLKWEYDILTADPTTEDWNTGFTQLGTGTCAMYIGASDAVDQPTNTNGLPAEELGLAPMPAGPSEKQYSLFGGSFYMFSKDATDAQINAALDYIMIMGKGPILDSDGFETDCQYRVEAGIPVINRFPFWFDNSSIDQEIALIDKYSNVDIRLYQDYFDHVKQEGNLRMEEGTGMMYIELADVIHAVMIDKDADVPALMKRAEVKFRQYFD